MSNPNTPELNGTDEFHAWCLNKQPQEKLSALLGSWEGIVGGPSDLKPVHFSFSSVDQTGVITFETDTEEKRTAVRGLQAFYQKGIGNSNLQLPPAPEDGTIRVGGAHGYLTTLVGIASQYRHMFGGRG